ncbi:MAG TPA: hypothetical protein PK402_11760, partial [Tepidisphaeraceae bacterium]|nr:hypothetical protein [Tepidisphaeraceae bacterium]
ARKMVTEWGMNDRIGFVFYGEDDRRQMFDMGGNKEFSDDTAKAIDEEVKKLIDRLFDETRSILETHRDKLDALAKALIKHETLDAIDVDRVMRGEFVMRPTVADLLDESTRPPGPRVVNSPPANPDIPPGAIPAT